mmetsp:Transcript_90891/g.276046  ORF Transcript_90891/g.276046 Transcript_90891/m.276046 type:complete len:272 (-) Transcript_90891:1173-1988(-)
MRASSLSMLREFCSRSPAVLTSATAAARRSKAPSKEFRKAQTRTRRPYSGRAMSMTMKCSGSSQTSPPSQAAVSCTAARTMASSSAPGRLESKRSTFSGLSTSSSILAMACSSTLCSGIRASMNQIWRRRCSSNSRRFSARGFSATEGRAESAGWSPGASGVTGGISEKRASSSSGSKPAAASARWIRSQTLGTSPASLSATGDPPRLMGVQKSFFMGTFGSTSGFRGSAALPLPRGAPFIGGAPLPLPFPFLTSTGVQLVTFTVFAHTLP